MFDGDLPGLPPIMKKEKRVRGLVFKRLLLVASGGSSGVQGYAEMSLSNPLEEAT